MNRSFHRRATAVLLSTLVVAQGCADRPPEEVGTRRAAIYGNVAGIDWHIDAPWRIEPNVNSDNYAEYDAVPITIAFHDGREAVDGPDPTLGEDPHEELGGYIPDTGLGAFCGLEIYRFDEASSDWIFDHEYKPDALHEYQMESTWTPGNIPVNATVRRWKGESLGSTATVDDHGNTVLLDQQNPFHWSGWNAVALWKSHTTFTPGTTVLLRAVAVLAKDCSIVDGKQAGDGPQFDRRKGTGGDYYYAFRQLLRVRFGHPLPRFDNRYAYGDLHYHAEGTDNEGESGHSFRAVVQSMRAIGLDWTYATDHTSGSRQLTDSKVPQVSVPFNIPILSGMIDDAIKEILDNFGFGPMFSFALRDMNDLRFDTLVERINNGTSGVNREAVSAPGALRASQIFLGGETDVIPEMSKDELTAGLIPYGNGLLYPWRNACSKDALPSYFFKFTPDICDGVELFDTTDDPNRFQVLDIQAVGKDKARQHVLMLPHSGVAGGRVAVDTGPVGGASMRLSQFISKNEGTGGEDRSPIGWFFLAHPVDAASGNGTNRLGPDMVPYSDVQLRTAYNAKSFLGLQLWNENERVRTKGGIGPMSYRIENRVVAGIPTQQDCVWQFGSPDGNVRVQYLNSGSSMCVRDTASSGGNWGFPTIHGVGTHDLAPVANGGLAPLHAPPYPADDVTRLVAWQERFDTTESNLFHGATTWDKMLRWGVHPDSSDPDLKKWLPADQPRKVFMAGGSDAHGDFNYRQGGYATGWQGTSDAALGKPRNYVYVGTSRPSASQAGPRVAYTVSQSQVADALSTGNFSVTDGPAVRIAFDANDNGVLDDGDVPMGGHYNPPDPSHVPVVVEWRSSAEFGPVSRVDLYVGNARVTYAPENHGVRGNGDQGGTPTWPVYAGNSNTPSAWRYDDGYYQPLHNPGQLRHVPGQGSLSGSYRFLLDMSDFPAFDATCEVKQVCQQVWVPEKKECNSNGDCITIPAHWENQCQMVPECRSPELPAAEDFYVRAFVETQGDSEPVQDDPGAGTFQNVDIPRYGYTNPVWLGNYAAPNPDR